MVQCGVCRTKQQSDYFMVIQCGMQYKCDAFRSMSALSLVNTSWSA